MTFLTNCKYEHYSTFLDNNIDNVINKYVFRSFENYFQNFYIFPADQDHPGYDML